MGLANTLEEMEKRGESPSADQLEEFKMKLCALRKLYDQLCATRPPDPIGMLIRDEMIANVKKILQYEKCVDASSSSNSAAQKCGYYVGIGLMVVILVLFVIYRYNKHSVSPAEPADE